MPDTTLTSKGQMTLPKAIRDKFNLKSGDRLDVVVEGNRIVLVPATRHLSDLSGLLPRPKRSLTDEQLDAAIRKRASLKRP